MDKIVDGLSYYLLAIISAFTVCYGFAMMIHVLRVGI